MFEVLDMTHNKFDTMGKRLDHNSRGVMLRFGRVSQDPADIIVAAYEDEHIFATVRRILEESEFTLINAIAEASQVKERPDFKSTRGSDGIQLESFTLDMREVLVRLADDYTEREMLSQADRDAYPWDWTKQLVRYALEAIARRVR